MTAPVQTHKPSLVRGLAIVSLIYLVVYFVAAYLDLHTTRLALQQPGTTEGNVYSTSDSEYSSTTAWMITGIAAPIILGFLIFGLVNAHRVSQHWLEHPVQSFGKFYIIPWRKKILDRSPLHMASFAMAFPALRLLAAGNNLLIYKYGTAPLGWLVGIAAKHTSPTIGFWLVLGPLFCLLAVAFAPLAANVLTRFQQGHELAPREKGENEPCRTNGSNPPEPPS
jgi:hypothetical protein